LRLRDAVRSAAAHLQQRILSERINWLVGKGEKRLFLKSDVVFYRIAGIIIAGNEERFLRRHRN
jgi:hypothetical protein